MSSLRDPARLRGSYEKRRCGSEIRVEETFFFFSQDWGRGNSRRGKERALREGGNGNVNQDRGGEEKLGAEGGGYKWTCGRGREGRAYEFR